MSYSCASSNSSSASSLNHIDLGSRACTILMALSNSRDEAIGVKDLISERVVVQHDEDEPVSSRAALLGTRNDLTRKLVEAVVDEAQMKVWVRSQIRGFVDGIFQESIDMMTFNEEGILVRSEAFQRVMKRSRRRE